MTSPDRPGADRPGAPRSGAPRSGVPRSGVPRSSADRAAVTVLGATVDDQTRCNHYRGPLDVVAIRFYCCGEFYPCFRCHADAVDHALSVWPRDEFDTHALLCGACQTTLSITEYQSVDACPACGTAFNPGCSLHYPLYFES